MGHHRDHDRIRSNPLIYKENDQTRTERLPVLPKPGLRIHENLRTKGLRQRLRPDAPKIRNRNNREGRSSDRARKRRRRRRQLLIANSGISLYVTLSKKWVVYDILTECVEKPLASDEPGTQVRQNPRGEYFQIKNNPTR